LSEVATDRDFKIPTLSCGGLIKTPQQKSDMERLAAQCFTRGGEPLFCAKDVAVALGYGNSREALRKHVEQEDVTKRDTPTAGGTQQMQYVNESGRDLYRIICGLYRYIHL
jgi:prophage antirepressor-like protein